MQLKKLIFVIIFSCGLFLIGVPLVDNGIKWKIINKKAKYLRLAYLHEIHRFNNNLPITSIDDLLSNETKSILIINGIDWKKINYHPINNNVGMLGNNILFSYQDKKYFISIYKSGSVLIERNRGVGVAH